MANPSAVLAPPYRRGRSPSAIGATVGPIPAAPATPNTPSPVSGTNPILYTLLSWVAAGATKADIYLGTNPSPPLLAPSYVGTSYVPTLLPSTTYYWQIVARNDGGTAAGPIWSFTTPSATKLFIARNGTYTPSVRAGSITIHDQLGAAANTATAVFDTTAPNAGNLVTMGLGGLDATKLIFGGEIQTQDQTFVGHPNSPLWPEHLIDYTSRFNKRRPVASFVSVSATDVLKYLVAVFAPGFTTTRVQAGLPPISITFDGTQDLSACSQQVAALINGYFRLGYDKDVQLSQVASTDSPDPLDATHKPLNDPTPITFSTDFSQIRTRDLVKGASVTILTTDVSAGETIVPLSQQIFEPGGGFAITGGQVLTYTGIQTAGGGSLVGPGAAPSVAPALALAAGTGLASGLYQYAYTDVTAAGESLPSPVAASTTGPLAPPATAPLPSTPTFGTGVDSGAHAYAASFVTSAGETTPSALSGAITTGTQTLANPTGAMNGGYANGGGPPYPFNTGDAIRYWAYTWVTAGGETLASPQFAPAGTYPLGGGGPYLANLGGIAAGPAGTTARKLYRTVAGGAQLLLVATIADNTTTSFTDTITDGALGANAPASNTATYPANVVPLTAIPTGGALVTSRNLYRTAAGGSQLKFLATIANNTTTTYTDATSDASLGANAPTSNTAAVNQVSLSAIAIGPATVTSRKVYRTAVGGSQLKLLTTIADNTTTTYTDVTADGSLGANVPVGDTSGLTLIAGQINAGSTALLTAGAGPFQPNGGWALAGSQVIRYTGITGNTLTGILATGPGAILTTLVYGSPILPLPAITGVNANNGLKVTLVKGVPISLWVQRDDLAAQAALGQLELDEHGNPTDGVQEFTIPAPQCTSVAMCNAVGDADLAIFSRPIVSVDYYTHSPTRSGQTVQIALTVGVFDGAIFDPAVFDVVRIWGLSGAFVVQSVDITFDGPELPRYHVKCASTKFAMEDLLRRVVVN